MTAVETFDHRAILARIANAPPAVIHGRNLEELNHAHPLAEYFAEQRTVSRLGRHTTRETTP